MLTDSPSVCTLPPEVPFPKTIATATPAKNNRLIHQPSIANLAAQRKNARNGWKKIIRICTNDYIQKVTSLFRPRNYSLPILPHPPFLLHHLILLDPTTEAITASLSTLSVDAQKRAEKDAKKKEAKAAAAESREKEAREQAMVYIKRVERNKRKYVTAVSGLEAHGMDLKKVAKEFG